MNRKLKYLIVLFTCLFIFPMLTNAWDEIASGGGTSSGSGGRCSDASGCCFCRWNNANFGSVKMTIIYYDGTTRYQLGNSVAYAKSTNDTWVAGRIKGVKFKKWLPYTSILSHSDYYSKLRDKLLGSTQKQQDYPIIREIFKDVGVNYDSLLTAAKTKGSYTDNVSGRKFDRIINEKIGINGTKTKGIRIIVEPIFVIQETGICPTYKAGLDRAMTVKKIMSFAYGKTDAGKKYLNDNTMTMFAKAMFIEKGDVGYYPVSANSLNLAEVSNPNSGWGLNIYGPFDQIPMTCDPDKSYEGYSSGIAYCCKTEHISNVNDKTNNVPANGGNMKRPLTEQEIADTKECNPNKFTCNPDKDGVAKCCKDFDITVTTPSSTQQELVDGKKLSRVMTKQELLDAGCNDDGGGEPCKYLIDYNAPSTCDSKDTNGHMIDTVNWDCAFASTKSKKEAVKDHYFEDEEFNNDYCSVFCKEKINYSFPASDTEAYSGRFLLVGNVESTIPSFKPIIYSGEKECRTTSAKGDKSGKINVTKFLKDVEEVDEEIKKAWDEWKILQAQQTACNKQTTQYYNDISYTCESATTNYSTKIAAAKEKYEKAIEKRKKHVNQITACTKFGEAVNYDNFNPEVVFSYDEPTYGFDKFGNNKTWTLKVLDFAETLMTTYHTGGDAVSGKSTSQSQIPNYTDLPVYNCTGNTPCTKSTTVKYPITTWWKKEFKKDIEYGLPDGTYQYIAKATGESFDSMAEAGGENSINMEAPNLPVHFSTMAGRYNFNITTKTFGDDNKFNKFLMDEGDSVKFGDETYEGSKDYSCKFTVKCDRHMITTDTDKYCEICGEEVRTCGKKLCGKDDPECLPCDPERDTCNPCSYDDPSNDPENCPTTDECTPDKPKVPGKPGNPDNPGNPDKPVPCKRIKLDINLIFRPISLYTPGQAFPGPDGSEKGRNPGNNWYSLDESIVKTYITNGRGVENYEIYKESPMYEVILTPSLMKEIKKYNKEQNGKVLSIYEETGIAGYSDYDSMVCKGNGKTCLSKIIRKNSDGSGWGVTGCGIAEGFDSTKYNKCPASDEYGQWGLND